MVEGDYFRREFSCGEIFVGEKCPMGNYVEGKLSRGGGIYPRGKLSGEGVISLKGNDLGYGGWGQSSREQFSRVESYFPGEQLS